MSETHLGIFELRFQILDICSWFLRGLLAHHPNLRSTFWDVCVKGPKFKDLFLLYKPNQRTQGKNQRRSALESSFVCCLRSAAYPYNHEVDLHDGLHLTHVYTGAPMPSCARMSLASMYMSWSTQV